MFLCGNTGLLCEAWMVDVRCKVFGWVDSSLEAVMCQNLGVFGVVGSERTEWCGWNIETAN